MNIFEDEYEEHFSDDLSQAEKAVLHLNLPYNVRKIHNFFRSRHIDRVRQMGPWLHCNIGLDHL